MSRFLLLLLLLAVSVNARTQDIVLNNPEDQNLKHDISDNETSKNDKNEIKVPSGVGVKLLEIKGLIRHRYATMDVHAEVENHGNISEETTFVLHLPENAFISRASLEAEGERMEGEVRERKTAQAEYQEALEAGTSAAHVSTLSARDSSEVRISVNVGPQAKAIFNLTYEELLVRRKGRYEVAVNLNYEQQAELVRVEINVNESSNLSFIRVPPFNSSLDQDGKDDTRDNPNVLVERDGNMTCCARIFYESRGESLPGPLLIRYDVDHSAPGGEVLMQDGYFVHFLAVTPERVGAPPLPKHAIFVLDSSGSMWGRKLIQLKGAMSHILSQLRREDVFSVVTFSTSAAEWSIQGLEPAAGRGVYSATRRNIALAQDFINRMEASGATNIQSALRRALTLAWRYRNVTLAPGVSEGSNYTTTTAAPEKSGANPTAQPVIMFLTDGMPTAGELRLNRILSVAKQANAVAKASIFALAFGEGANLGFLRKLSLQNGGFSRRIYEAADAPLQLQSFYEEVASPLLTNLTFVYIDSKVNSSSVTARHFPTYFAGTEAVVAGRLLSDENDNWAEIPAPSFNLGAMSAQTSSNTNLFEKISLEAAKATKSKTKRKRPGRLERAWAFLTIKQLLDAATLQEQEEPITAPTPVPIPSAKDKSPRGKAISIALKYGFVTPVTSLVMVARNSTSGVLKEAAVQIANAAGSESSENVSIQDKVIPAPIPPRLPPGILVSSSGVQGLPGFPGLPAKTTTVRPLPQPPSTAQPAAENDWLTSRLQDGDKLYFCLTPDSDEVIIRTVLKDFSSQSEALSAEGEDCKFKNGTMEISGSCRHLMGCPVTPPDFNTFLQRFCDIQSTFVGVCCLSTLRPDEIF